MHRAVGDDQERSSDGVVIPFRPKPIAPRSQTDAELLMRCRNRDAAAWDELVSRYERLIYSVALRNGVSAEDAADITQTTFVELIDALDRIRDTERLASWLMTVARRQAWRTRSAARRTQPTDELLAGVDDPFSDWGTLTVLHDGLATLGGPCRELLQALYFDPDEPSYEEIAGRLNRSIGGIGPMRGRCLKRLREIIGEDSR